jgi:hypothetical protein
MTERIEEELYLEAIEQSEELMIDIRVSLEKLGWHIRQKKDTIVVMEKNGVIVQINRVG